MELKVTDNNFEEEVRKSSMPVLVDFYADWCGPCKMMAPLVAQLAEAYEGKCKIGKCNVDENQELAREFRVMSIPTFIFFKDGKAVETVIGAVSKNELEAKIKQVLA
ncbi:MAG: thioredoxin [Firmicutes bacterium]|nr:thioredoxin [Bacillota bacterium]